MADAGFFKGTSVDQDRRFGDKEAKLIRSMKFPPQFEKKVDLRKVNVTVMRPWVGQKIVELVGFEDEVVVEYAMGLLEDKSKPTPDPKSMQVNLQGFLQKDTPAFMLELWNLLLEAQESTGGIPQSFVEAKKEELRKARETDGRAFEERDRRARLDEIRDRERQERGYGAGRGGGRGRGFGRGSGRGGRDDFAPRREPDRGWPRRRSPSRSRSPPRHRRGSRSRSGPPSPRYYRRRSPSPARSRTPRYSLSPDGRRPNRAPRSISRSRSPPMGDSPPPRRARPRSRSPGPDGDHYHGRRNYDRSRSPQAKRRRRSPSRERSITPHYRRSISPVDRPYRSRDHEYSNSRRSRSHSVESRHPHQPGSQIGIDSGSTPQGEIRIKGQASRKMEQIAVPENHDMDLDRRETELKEKALRAKVVRSRKPASGRDQD